MQEPIVLATAGVKTGLANNQDANKALETIATCFLGPAAPDPSYPGQWWVDTGTTIDASGGPWVRQRNSANSAWLRRFRCDLDFVNSLGSVQLPAGAGIVFEGATDDGFETTLVAADPTADRTATLPDADITVAGTNHEQNFTALQKAKDGTLTDGATIAWDCGSSGNGQIVSVTTAAARTFGAPTNVKQNVLYLILLTTGGYTPAWNAAYKWATAPSGLASGTYAIPFIGGAGNTLIPIGDPYKTGA